jgi:glycogen debranching enzyme
VQTRVVLVEGSCFAVSAAGGEIGVDPLDGLYYQDRRLVSRLEVRVNGVRPEPLGATVSDRPTGEVVDPSDATFVYRAHSGAATGDPTLLLSRRRLVGRGMREDLELRNYGREAAYCSLEVLIDSDFAEVLAAKLGGLGDGSGGRAPAGGAGEDQGAHPTVAGGQVWTDVEPGALAIHWQRGPSRRGVRVAFGAGAKVDAAGASFELIVAAGGSWSTCIEVSPLVDAEVVVPRHRCGEPVERTVPMERLARWRRQVPMVTTDHVGFESTLARSAEDLGSLRLFDPDHPERLIVAGGLPWAMTLVGRDALLASWMALPLDPDLALGVLQTLARFQGREVDPRTEEEPGRILHHMRFGDATDLSLDAGQSYYGTADASPLFVMLLGELRRWGLAREIVDELLPHADRALEWVTQFGDRDGDGYVEYQRATDRGLPNQGWKESPTAVRSADGSVAETPIALCEVQAYVYAGYVARGHFAREAGDEAAASVWFGRAAALKEAFNRDFWLPHRGWYAMALDARKQPADALASNVGHCLWTGIVDEDKADEMAKRLVSPEMLSGWGVRTLASSMAGYNPMSLHCGSVWPHDAAIVAAGLMRYGYVEEAVRVVMQLVDAAEACRGRLPELYCGLGRDELPAVLAHPTACAPHALASSVPLLLLRTLLRLDPWVPQGKVWLSPVVPEEMGDIVVDRVPLGGGRVRIEAHGGSLKVEGMPAGLEVVQAGRSPVTAG